MESRKKVISSFVEKKNVRLPPGFRFHPTDEELVVQYLKRKVFSRPLPADIIPDLHLCCNSDPWDLPPGISSSSDLEEQEEKYFFSTKEAKYPNGNRSNRATNSGYWKATGLDKQIITSKGNQLVGMKKTLVFYRGKAPHGSRTDWIMHEYRLLIPTQETTNLNSMENWVLCRIFLKRRASATANKKQHHIFYDFLAQNKTTTADYLKNQLQLQIVSASSSSAATSGITQLSTNQSDHDEESTSSSSLLQQQL